MSRPHPESERELHAPLQTFDMESEIERLRGEEEWRDGRRNAITLRKGEGFSVVLLVMRGGDRIPEHSATGPISVAVYEGRIRFTTADEEVEAELVLEHGDRGEEVIRADDDGVVAAIGVTG